MGSPKAGKTNAQARAASRKELLVAGIELLKEEALLDPEERFSPMAHLKVRTVCERAGRTSGAFYMHWRSIEAYHQAVGEYLLAEVAAMTDGLQELMELARSARDAASPLDAIRDLARDDLRLLLESDVWDAVELLTVTWGREPERLRDAAVSGYRAADQLTADAYDILLQAFGRECRPPHTLLEVGLMLQAFIEGFGLRCRVDPGAVGAGDPGRLYAMGVASLLSVLTRERGDSRDVDEVLSECLRAVDERTAVPD